jgi:myosin V
MQIPDVYVRVLQVNYADNQPVLDILEAPLGIITLLDETCLLKHGDDAGFISLIKKQAQARAPHLLSTDQLMGGASVPVFSVAHSAIQSSMMQYDARGFVEKNRDKLQGDTATSLQGSSNTVVSTALKPQVRTSDHSMYLMYIEACL